MNQQNKDSNTSKPTFWSQVIEPKRIASGWKLIEPTKESYAEEERRYQGLQEVLFRMREGLKMNPKRKGRVMRKRSTMQF